MRVRLYRLPIGLGTEPVISTCGLEEGLKTGGTGG